MSDALDFLLKKAHRNMDGSLTVSRNLVMKVEKMMKKPKAKPRKKKGVSDAG